MKNLVTLYCSIVCFVLFLSSSVNGQSIIAVNNTLACDVRVTIHTSNIALSCVACGPPTIICVPGGGQVKVAQNCGIYVSGIEVMANSTCSTSGCLGTIYCLSQIACGGCPASHTNVPTGCGGPCAPNMNLTWPVGSGILTIN